MESLRERLGDYLVRPELLNEGPFHLDPNQLDHHYKQDGDNSKKSYPSVTTVPSDWLQVRIAENGEDRHRLTCRRSIYD